MGAAGREPRNVPAQRARSAGVHTGIAAAGRETPGAMRTCGVDLSGDRASAIPGSAPGPESGCGTPGSGPKAPWPGTRAPITLRVESGPAYPPCGFDGRATATPAEGGGTRNGNAPSNRATRSPRECIAASSRSIRPRRDRCPERMSTARQTPTPSIAMTSGLIAYGLYPRRCCEHAVRRVGRAP